MPLPLLRQDLESIEFMLQKGLSPQDVLKIVLGLTGRGSRTAVYRLTKRFKETGSVWPAQPPGKGGRPKLITTSMLDFIVEQRVKNSLLTYDDVHKLLVAEFPESTVSAKTVERFLHSEEFQDAFILRTVPRHDATPETTEQSLNDVEQSPGATDESQRNPDQPHDAADQASAHSEEPQETTLTEREMLQKSAFPILEIANYSTGKGNNGAIKSFYYSGPPEEDDGLYPNTWEIG